MWSSFTTLYIFLVLLQMASADKPSSQPASDVASDSAIDSTSDEVSLNMCGPCEHRGIRKQASEYCLSCKELLCSACKEYHTSFKEFRDHTFTRIQSGRRVLLDATVTNCRTVNIRMSTDKRSPQVTGCKFLSHSRVIICDQNNMRVKLLDAGNSYKVVDCLEFPSEVRTVSIVDSKTVIVTITDHKCLQYVNIGAKMEPGRIILLPKMPLAVEYLDGELFVTCKKHRQNGTGEVMVLDKEGTVKRKLGVRADGTCMFDAPTHLAVNSASNNVIVSDRDTSIVTCLAPDGSVIYQYKSPELTRPRGVYVDAVGNVLVCGESSTNVVILTSDGKKHGILLTDKEIRKQPCSIALDGSNEKLLIGCYNTEKMLEITLR